MLTNKMRHSIILGGKGKNRVVLIKSLIYTRVGRGAGVLCCKRSKRNQIKEDQICKRDFLETHATPRTTRAACIMNGAHFIGIVIHILSRIKCIDILTNTNFSIILNILNQCKKRKRNSYRNNSVQFLYSYKLNSFIEFCSLTNCVFIFFSNFHKNNLILIFLTEIFRSGFSTSVTL